MDDSKNARTSLKVSGKMKKGACGMVALTILLSTICFVGSSTPPRRAAAAEQVEEKASEGRTAGLAFKRYTVRDVPWSINVVRISRSRTNLFLTTTLGEG